MVVIKLVAVSFSVPLPPTKVPLTGELSVIPSLGKTIGVPDVTVIDPSVDDVEFCKVVSFLVLSIGSWALVVVEGEVESNPAVEGISVVVVFAVVFVVVDNLVGFVVVGFGVVGLAVVDLVVVSLLVVGLVVVGLVVVGLFVVVNFWVDVIIVLVEMGALVASTGFAVDVEAGISELKNNLLVNELGHPYP